MHMPRLRGESSRLGPVALGGTLPDERELCALVETYPPGALLHFRSYEPTAWPRDWRRLAERAPWGLRPGDELEVVGYGAARGVPEALLVRRVADGLGALVFPAELLPALGAPPAPRTAEGTAP